MTTEKYQMAYTFGREVGKDDSIKDKDAYIEEKTKDVSEDVKAAFIRGVEDTIRK